MAKLIALTPCAGLLPVTAGKITLSEVTLERVQSVAPFAGRDKAVSAKMKGQIGVGLASANRMATKGDIRVQWFGHGVYLVIGDASLDDLVGMAAVTDQSDAWAAVRLDGPGVEDVLARLVPVDLRPTIFKRGHTVRTMLGHMSVAVTRVGPKAVEVMAMRSMAGTLVHELSDAMRGWAARS